MNDLCSLWLKSASKEAVFTALWLALDKTPGTFRDVSLAELVRVAARFGAVLSDSQAGKRLKELASLGLVEKVPTGKRGRFDLIVRRPREFRGEIGGEIGGEIEREIGENALNAEKSDVCDASSAAANAVEREMEKSPLKKNNKININKKINKPTDGEVLKEEIPNDDAAKPTRADAPTRSTDEIRRRIDFSNPKIARLRAEIAKRIWEPSVNPDLIDRAAAAVVLKIGGASWLSVRESISAAVEESAKTKRAQFRKSEPIWRFFALSMKRLYENAGWIWTPTRFADEPNPNAEKKSAPKIADSDAPSPPAPQNVSRPDADAFESELAEFAPLGTRIVAPPKLKRRPPPRRGFRRSR